MTEPEGFTEFWRREYRTKSQRFHGRRADYAAAWQDGYERAKNEATLEERPESGRDRESPPSDRL